MHFTPVCPVPLMAERWLKVVIKRSNWIRPCRESPTERETNRRSRNTKRACVRARESVNEASQAFGVFRAQLECSAHWRACATILSRTVDGLRELTVLYFEKPERVPNAEGTMCPPSRKIHNIPSFLQPATPPRTNIRTHV